MISRVAEGCFWLTRYLERVDTLARLLDVHHTLHIDAGIPAASRWDPVRAITGQAEDFRARVGAKIREDGEDAQAYLTWNEEHPSSLFSAVRSARENARTVREIMSLEAWEAINDLWLWLRGREARRTYERNRSEFYEHLTRSAVLFHGVCYATMPHDEPFTFMKLGRAVERVGQIARTVDALGRFDTATSATADAACSLEILRSCCAFDPFFRTASQPLGRQAVTEFLLFDRSSPRSVLYNLDEARSLLFALRRGDPTGLPRRSRSALERMRGELLQMDSTDLRERGLHTTLDWVGEATDRLCQAIHDDYLDPPLAWMRHCVRAIESLEAESAGIRAA